MKTTLTILIAIFLMSGSCRKELAPDEELTLQKQNYNDTTLRIDGYYYSEFNDIYSVLFFYSNGVLFSGGDVFNNKLQEFEVECQNGVFWNNHKDKKMYWGLFNIDGTKIVYEKWYVSSGGGLPVYKHLGEILNDTTFIINKSIRSKTGDEKEHNETYHFRKFSPKPDSTNSFIN